MKLEIGHTWMNTVAWIAPVVVLVCACGDSTPTSVSLAVSPSPVQYLPLPTKGTPGSPPPPCCRQLVADFQLSIRTTREAEIESVSLRVTRSDGAIYDEVLDQQTLARDVGTTRTGTAAGLVIPIHLLASFDQPVQVGQYVLHLEVDVVALSGERLRASLEAPMSLP